MLRSILDARCIPGPFQSGPRHSPKGAEKSGRVLGDGEHDAVRDVLEYVVVLDFVPGRRIELGKPLANALRDFGLGTRLENTLQVVIAPMCKYLVLSYQKIPDTSRTTFGKEEKEANR